MLKTNFSDFENEKNNEANVNWKANNALSTFSFVYPPAPDSLTDRFIRYVFENPGMSRMDFYEHIGREYAPGNNSSFFAAIKDAGIVEMVGNKYYIGPNYGAWTQGKLKNTGNLLDTWHSNIFRPGKTGNRKTK